MTADPKNFLELVQESCSECNIAGLNTVPTTVVNQSGELGKFVRWGREAYNEIQNLHPDWKWQRRNFSLVVDTGGDGSYSYSEAIDIDTGSAITRFRRWLMADESNQPTGYLTASGTDASFWLNWMDYEDFRTIYLFGVQNESQPQFISVDPQNNLLVGPKPADSYTILSEYQRANQILDVTDGTDFPEMPADYHDLIKWRIVLKYALDESNQTCLNKWNTFGLPMENDLEINQLPDIYIDGPMA